MMYLTADCDQNEGIAEEYHKVVFSPLIWWLIEENCVEKEQRHNGATNLNFCKVKGGTQTGKENQVPDIVHNGIVHVGVPEAIELKNLLMIDIFDQTDRRQNLVVFLILDKCFDFEGELDRIAN